METLECILKRKSVRNYSDQEVSNDDLRKILQAGINAPTALNKQNLFFVAINSKEKVLEFKRLIGGGEEYYNAPAIIIVFEKFEDRYINLNAGAACMNILLEATDLQLSSCWIDCTVSKINANINEISKLIGINKMKAIASIAIGYSAKDTPKRIKDETNYKIC